MYSDKLRKYISNSAYVVCCAMAAYSFSKSYMRRREIKILEESGEGKFTMKDPGSVLLIGDSITQYSFDLDGFGASLSHWYARRMNVINRGFSGYNSMWMLQVMKVMIGQVDTSAPWNLKFPNAEIDPPVLAIILLGSNDCTTHTDKPDSQSVTPDEYEKNINAIIDLLIRFSRNVKIILLTPPPVDETAWIEHKKLNYGASAGDLTESDRLNSSLTKYADKIRYIASERKLALLDLFEDMPVEGHLIDGLHLSEKGNQFVTSGLKETIKKHFPELEGGDDSPLSMYFPHWSDAHKVFDGSSL